MASAVAFEVEIASLEEAHAIRDDVVTKGVEAEVRDEAGFLPVAVLLAIVIPPGIALLAEVVNRIIHSWKDHGTLIDARVDPPKLIKEAGLPFGTVVVLTKDGDKSERSDLSEVDVATYIGKALEAVSGGASASEADSQAAEQTSEGERAEG